MTLLLVAASGRGCVRQATARETLRQRSEHEPLIAPSRAWVPSRLDDPPGSTGRCFSFAQSYPGCAERWEDAQRGADVRLSRARDTACLPVGAGARRARRRLEPAAARAAGVVAARAPRPVVRTVPVGGDRRSRGPGRRGATRRAAQRHPGPGPHRVPRTPKLGAGAGRLPMMGQHLAADGSGGGVAVHAAPPSSGEPRGACACPSSPERVPCPSAPPASARNREPPCGSGTSCCT